MRSSPLPALCAGLVLVLGGFAPEAFAGRFKLHKIVDSTESVPGGSGNFIDFGYPQVSEGNVAFLTGDTVPLANSVCLWTPENGVVPIYGQADQFSGGITLFFPPGISGTTVGFCGAGPGGNGVYRKPPGGPIQTILLSTPGQAGFGYLQSSTPVSGDKLAFTAYYRPGTSGTYTKGVYISSNGGAPGLVATDIGGYEYEVALSGASSAYVAGYSGSQTVRVSDRGQIAGPTVLGTTYTDFSDVSISGSNVAFVARNSAGASGIYLHNGSTIIEVARRGQKMPGAVASGHATGRFQYFAHPCVAGNRVAFYAEDGISSYNNGIYLYENGHIVPVVDGHTVFGGQTAKITQGFLPDFSLVGGNQSYDGTNIGIYVRYRNGVKALWLVEDTHHPSGNPPSQLPPGVSGKVLFEKVLPGRNGLDFQKTRWLPAVGIPVLAVSESGILGSARTDSEGRYSILINPPATFAVAAFAQTDVALVSPFVSPPSAYTVFSREAQITAPGQGVERNLRIADQDQASAPFNILATVQKGADLVRAADPSVSLDRVDVRWAPDYDGGTAYFGEEDLIKVNGNRRGAGARYADEFNEMAVLHEYGHYLQRHFSHPSDFGGVHRRGNQLDPRVAWNEGWGNFFAAASLDHSIFYLVGKNTTQLYPLEPNRLSFDKPPGYWSEFSVASALWHIYSPATRHTEGKHLGLGFAPIWQAFTALKGKPFVFVGDFLDQLAAQDFSLGPDLNAITQARGFPFAAGGNPSVTPVWRQQINFGQTLAGAADSFRKSRQNLLESSAFYFFDKPGDGNALIQLDVANHTAPHSNLDLYLWDSSQNLVTVATTYDTGTASTKSIAAGLAAGRYFIEVRSWSQEEFAAPVYNGGTFTLKLVTP